MDVHRTTTALVINNGSLRKNCVTHNSLAWYTGCWRDLGHKGELAHSEVLTQMGRRNKHTQTTWSKMSSLMGRIKAQNGRGRARLHPLWRWVSLRRLQLPVPVVLNPETRLESPTLPMYSAAWNLRLLPADVYPAPCWNLPCSDKELSAVPQIIIGSSHRWNRPEAEAELVAQTR